MRVHIGPIRNKRGSSIEVSFDRRFPSPFGGDGPKTLPVSVRAEVENSGRTFRVEGEIITNLELECNRCLEKIKYPVVISFEEHFHSRHQRLEPNLSGMDEDEFEMNSSRGIDKDGDMMFDGDSFTLDNVVRDYLLLESSVKVTCRDDCQGLCSQCGQNRNEMSCSCDEGVIDPRLAGLTDFFKNE